jgi:hypothetical protein
VHLCVKHGAINALIEIITASFRVVSCPIEEIDGHECQLPREETLSFRVVGLEKR